MWGDLSPEASRAVRLARGREALKRAWHPKLARTQELAIILRPEEGGRRHQLKWFEWIGQHLDWFTYNDKLNRWEAPLVTLAEAAKILKRNGISNFSQGVREYLEGNHDGMSAL